MNKARILFAVGGVGGAVGITEYLWHRYQERRSANTKDAVGIGVKNGFSKWDNNWDRRNDLDSLISPSVIANCKGEATCLKNARDTVKAKHTRHIFLIRHGQYATNGDTDHKRVLTALGRQQAQYTGKRLKTMDVPFSKMYNSHLKRAIETADIIAQELSVPRDADAMLNEGYPCMPEPPSSTWHPDPSVWQESSRIEAAFSRHIHRALPSAEGDVYEIIVCHANVIRYFVCRALQFPQEGWLRMSLANGSITYLIVRPSGRVTLKSLGDCGHIPPEMITYS